MSPILILLAVGFLFYVIAVIINTSHEMKDTHNTEPGMDDLGDGSF